MLKPTSLAAASLMLCAFACSTSEARPVATTPVAQPAAQPAAHPPARLAAHAAAHPRAEPAPRRGPADAELPRLLSVRDGRTDALLSFDTLLDELAGADVVFLGESHTDETTHRVELAVYEGLLVRREGHVVLALEMFERDSQPALDAYLARVTDEATFLAAARPWGNYATSYRPLIETARAANAPVVASNFPRPLRARVAEGGPAALDELPADVRAQAPQTLLPNTPLYWRRADNAIRSHRAMMGGAAGGTAGGAAASSAAGAADATDAAAHAAAPPTPEEDAASAERLTSTQSLWDNAMGESCALALERHPDHSVLHVNGGFHSQFWDGTVRQLRLRKPEARVATVAIEPVASPGSAELGGAPEADYVIFAERRANDPQDGEGSVFVQRELKYKLHLPPSAKPGAAAARVPLLIWLSDDGLTAEESLALWKLRLGDEAAIAVLAAPYLETQEDLALGGRWFGADSFDEDIGVAATAVERTWAYLVDHTPVDPARVCLAGEGTGATVVAAAALYADRMAAKAVAIAPRRYSKLRDLSLPLPELRGSHPRPATSLRVVVTDRSPTSAGSSPADWWRDELAEYARVAFPAVLVPATDDAWEEQAQVVGEVRAALGLAAGTAAPVGSSSRRYVLADSGSPRGRLWAQLHAQRAAADGAGPVALVEARPADAAAAATPLSLDIRAADFAAQDALPACPGPFGGTTVVVLPPGTPPEEVAAWSALVENDPLTARNRFTRLRVSPTLEQLCGVLTQLESENRRNVLIVPAEFHADGETMRALRDSVSEFDERMTLHWLPGLGGR